jgi:hypothetical protein
MGACVLPNTINARRVSVNDELNTDISTKEACVLPNTINAERVFLNASFVV